MEKIGRVQRVLIQPSLEVGGLGFKLNDALSRLVHLSENDQ